MSINEQPGAVVAGDFNRDGPLDLAVLMQDTGQVWIYTGNGDGTFRHTFSIPVGDEATGLSVVPGSGPGLLDLLVGNGFGDVLHLQGKGDGTFQISGNRVSLSVVPDLLGPGQAGVLVGNQQDNRVTVQAPTAGGTQFSPCRRSAPPPSPHWLRETSTGRYWTESATLPDAVVVSSGSNSRCGLPHHASQQRRALLCSGAGRPTSSAPPRPASPWPTSTATASRTC